MIQMHQLCPPNLPGWALLSIYPQALGCWDQHCLLDSLSFIILFPSLPPTPTTSFLPVVLECRLLGYLITQTPWFSSRIVQSPKTLSKKKKKKYDHEGCALSECDLREGKVCILHFQTLQSLTWDKAEHSSTGDTGCLSCHALASAVVQIWLISRGVLGQLDPELDVQKEVFMLIPVEMNLTFEPGEAKEHHSSRILSLWNAWGPPCPRCTFTLSEELVRGW